MIKKINARNLLTLLLSCILCVAMAIAIVPQGAIAQTVATEKLVQTEFTNESWEIVNKDQTDVSEIKEESPTLSGLEFTSDGRFGGQIVSKDKYTGALTIEMDFSGTMDPNVAYTYMYIGRNSTSAISQENWSNDGGIVLGFHIKGVALYDETCTEQEMGEHWRCRFDSGVGFWRPIYSAGGYRDGNFSYKIVINASGVEVYSEYNTQYNDPNPLGRVTLANSDFSLTNGYIAISNRYSKYTLNSFKVNGNYTSVNDWDKHDGVTFSEGSNIPSQVVLKDVDNVKSSTSPITENPLLVSKFTVSTDGVEAGAEVFSLDLDVQTIRPRNDYFRFLIGLSENNDNPTKEINFTSLGVSDGGTCCYMFDSYHGGAYLDGLAINYVTISIKGYQNGNVVVTYKCPDPACPSHTATFTEVDVNGKIGIQTITGNDAPKSQGITIKKLASSESLFSGNVAKQSLITLTDGTNVKTEKVNSTNYTLPTTFTVGKTLIGWVDNEGKLQKPGKLYAEISDMTFTAVEVDLEFALEEGASIRIDTVGDTSGIRFTAMYNTKAMEEISEYVLEKGMLLVKTSAFAEDSTDAQKATLFIYKDTLAHAFAGEGVIKGDLTRHAYAIYDIGENDFETEISARAYIKINYADGEGFIYTDFSIANNSRSIKTVAEAMQGSDFYNNELDTEQQAVVDKYAGK